MECRCVGFLARVTQYLFTRGGTDSGMSKSPLNNGLEASDPSVEFNSEKVDFTKGNASQFKYYPDSPTSEINKLRFETKGPSKYYDPCSESSKMSIRCMEVNGKYNKHLCNEYFQAYRDCKKEWLAERRRERSKGGW